MTRQDLHPAPVLTPRPARPLSGRSDTMRTLSRDTPAGSAMTALSPQPLGEPVVRLEGIRKSFGAQEVLHGVDLSVHTGEHVVIFGPSGSGKSTLLRTINLLEEPSAGSVRVLGVEYGPGPVAARNAAVP